MSKKTLKVSSGKAKQNSISISKKKANAGNLQHLDNLDDIETIAYVILDRLGYLVEHNKRIRYKAEKLTRETQQMLTMMEK